VGIIGELGDKRHAFWFLLTMLVLPIFVFRSINVEKGKQDAHRFTKSAKGEEIPLVQKTDHFA
jgi:hypothetical protein